ncbi:Uu.00g100370.m01.CDS01 [Anthostomella pinea]|uniref:Uu.00g100370.m01.CDS01 n=1 Tax=Anthostomella pinea TaxID=933095 RepID=A0AAI8VDH9_9PEZI|nr:Uu.00g100370.m01.CDS01 [Anthostomella pinea]
MEPLNSSDPPQPKETQLSQLISALQQLVAMSPMTSTTSPARKQGLTVTPYKGDPESLHRFLAELTAKIKLKKWTDESDKIVIAKSLLIKGKSADQLIKAYRVLGQTTITQFDDWKACLTELCQDTGAQEKANRKLMEFYFDKNCHQSFAAFFAEFCVLAGKSLKTDETKYDQLVMGSPAWLRRLARPVPSKAATPNWRALAQHLNKVFVEDEQIKSDKNHWKGSAPTAVRMSQPRTTRQPRHFPINQAPGVTATVPQSSPIVPAGDPMDIDAIQTPQQATQLIKGKKLTDWI